MADKFWVSTYTFHILERGEKPIEPEWGDFGYNLPHQSTTHDEAVTHRELTAEQMTALMRAWDLDLDRLGLKVKKGQKKDQKKQ